MILLRFLKKISFLDMFMGLFLKVVSKDTTFFLPKIEGSCSTNRYLLTSQFTSKIVTINPLDKTGKKILRSEITGVKALSERELLLGRL